jgi:hypothetical protein
MTTTGWILITNFKRGGTTQPDLKPLSRIVEGLGSTSNTAWTAYDLHFPCCGKITAMRATALNTWVCRTADGCAARSTYGI